MTQQPSADQSAEQISAAPFQDQRDINSELAAADAPAELKQVLAELLAQQVVKTTSQPPTQPNAKVDDLTAVSDAGLVTFSWSYRNPGDYDLNGEANASDLAVLGRWLNVSSNSPDWAEARVADGDRNGTVTVADIAPLAANYLSKVLGYELRYSATPQDAGSWTTIGDMPLAEGTRAPGGIEFSLTLGPDTLPPGMVFFHVAPYSAGQLGIPSNGVTLEESPPLIATVTPLGGRSGETLQFAADVFGDGPFTYAWDFGGAGTADSDIAANPQVTLGQAGSYNGVLLVGNAVGEDSFDFTVQVTQNLKPLAQLVATPNAGPAPLTVELSAVGSSDPDGSIARYEWDLDGNGSFEFNSGTTPTATATLTTAGAHTLAVRVTDNDGATATATAPVTVAALPSAVVSANLTQVTAPSFVSFDGSKSSSPNGAIVQYEWDWDGNGLVDATTTTPTHRQMVDGRPGEYNATLKVTDASGASNTASIKIYIVAAIMPTNIPSEAYQDFSKSGDSAVTKWLKNSYSTLPEWRDANGPYQTGFHAVWSDQLFTLLNAQRAQHGLAPVIRVPQLDLVVQAHCRDEALRSYFSHTNPEGLNHETRPKAVNPLTSNWGEVLALGQNDPADCMAKWMQSADHRQIILSPLLSYAGVGIYFKPIHTQGLENYWGVQFAQFATDPATHDWIEPQEVVK